MSGDTFGRILSGIWLNTQSCTGQVPTTNTCVCAQSLSHVSLFVSSWTAAHQLPPPLEFSKPEHWSGLPFPVPGDLSDLGIEPASPVSPALAGRCFTTEPPGKPSQLEESQNFFLHLLWFDFFFFKLKIIHISQAFWCGKFCSSKVPPL